ncbi:MAG: glycerate kinase [Acidobacteria bacterium]|nr:glycerate kinase [Acidobacteriota bacterium]
MNILIAPNAFKGTLTALEAAQAMQRGVTQSLPEAECSVFPMADGGSGTIDALLAIHGGTRIQAMVSGPLGNPVQAEFAVLGDHQTAVVEMAQASGLKLVPESDRDPFRTTSFGTGELLLRAVEIGASTIILGIGDTATIDGGAGLLQALGVSLTDAQGQELPPGNTPLAALSYIKLDKLDSRLRHIPLLIACDVQHQLSGPQGAVYVFGPQKGARPQDLPVLEANLTRLADHLERATGKPYRNLPGSGAAGGIGGTLVSVLDARLVSGSSLLIKSRLFQDALSHADLVLTGEGSLDQQSLAGKGPWAVAQAAKAQQVPVYTFVGRCQIPAETAQAAGFTRVIELPQPDSFECPGPTLEQAVAQTMILKIKKL